MDSKSTVFYRDRTAVLVDFSGEEISSDGAIVLLEKLERRHKLLKTFSKLIPDYRHPLRTVHSMEKLVKQRVYMLMQGYEDTNDVFHLQNDPFFELCYACIDRYVSGLDDRQEIIIDIDATDDPTHGTQQLSMFNGYYGQFMYNELFFHDGVSGQIILPVLRPGNSHSNRWYAGILCRIIKRIRAKYPDITIMIRADSGFSCPSFYRLAEKYNLLYTIGLASNDILKNRSARVAQAVETLYVKGKKKHQHFFSFPYQAGTWDKEQMCHCKVESTGIGLNIRYVISNLAYEMFRLLKAAIAKTPFKEAKTWQIDTIRTRLLKIGATLKITKRRIYYRLSKAFVFQDMFKALVFT